MIATGATVLLSLSLLVPHVLANSQALHFDAGWWHQADSAEQQGFIYCYGDCFQPAHRPSGVSIDEEQTFVDKALDSPKTAIRGSVVSAIHLSWRTLESKPIPKGAEMWPGPHGYLDGGWWGGFNGPWPQDIADEDRGYLEGYLECRSGNVTAGDVLYFQRKLNQHYASGRRERDKIAVVLQALMRSRAAGSK
jgi:hypothetical protein